MILFARAGTWVMELTGWRRAGLAFAAGSLSATAFAPLEFFPAQLLGLAVLVLLLDGAGIAPSGASPRKKKLSAGFVIGWAFGFGQFLIGLHWIGYAFLVDPAAHFWQMPFALVSLPAGLALFTGAVCALSLYFWRDGPARLLVFSVFYAVAEWLRGHVLTGFPWNLPAYGWGSSLALMQSMSVIGAYGLSFLTLLLGAALADVTRPGAWKAPAAMFLVFAGLWTFGTARLVLNPTQTVPGVALRIVQPAIPQREKEQSRYYSRNWQRLLDLSAKPGNPSLIIWPEAAPPPFLFNRSQIALDEIGLLTAGRRTLITGATRAQSVSGKLLFYNSLFIFWPNGASPLLYDKFHLVPFGEYVPFANIFNKIGVTKLTDGEEGFSTGDGPHIFAIPGAPKLTPLICYEVIFPGAVTPRQQSDRPGWFVNVTDDSWFGPWAGPYQHFMITRARAIEEGLPVARAANTGISAVIDPFGRVTARLGLGKMGVLDARLPTAIAPTTYARYNDLTFLLMLIAATALAFIFCRK